MKKIVLVLTILFSTITLFAGPVDREQAYKNAQIFFVSQGRNAKLEKPLVSRGEASDQPYYIFNAENNQGYVIASGDDRTMQVLGFGNSGNIDVTNIPQNLKGLLDSYARQIKALGNSRFVTTSPAGSGKADIVPLLTTTWNQGTPYNNSINISFPGTAGEKPYTGCTATAMAQVINYYKYPDALVATIPAYTTEKNHYEIDAVNSGSIIDWRNILDSYSASSNDAQKKAIADLMLFCSNSIKSDYIDLKQGTSASMEYCPMALVDYFGYDPTARIAYSDYYTIDGWNNLIYDELAAARPVLYAGSSLGGGHAFVVDGYRSDGYYHINWGWGGLGNGFFLLYVANPYNTTSAGASNTHDGFSISQRAIIGVQHGVSNTDSTRLYAVLEGFDDESIYFTIYNTFPKTLSYEFGIGYYDASNNINTVLSFNIDNLDYYSGYHAYKLEKKYLQLSNLAPGKYNLFAVSRIKGSEKWLRSGDLQVQTINVVIDDSGQKTFSQTDYGKPDVTVTFPGNKVVDNTQTVKVEITAKNAEYHGPIYLLTNSTSTMPALADYQVGVELAQGESDDIELYFTPTKAGNWNIWITTFEPKYDEQSRQYILSDYFILGQTSVSITDGTGIERVTVNTDKNVKNEKLYNIAGQKVNKNYKGLVVKNGKKEVFVK